MRRSPIVIIATAAGVAGILSYHTSKPKALGAAAPSTTTPSTAAPSGSSGSTSTTAPTGPTTTAPAGGSHSATGKTVQYGYGELAVKVTVQGSRITQVKLAKLATAESYSQSLAEQVAPTLSHEVLQAQSARIQAISGATYTSEAYARSVQAALDSLHA